MISEQLMTPGEVAQKLNVSARTVRRLALERAIPSVRIGKSYRFRRESIEQYISTHETDMAVCEVYQLDNGPKSLNGFLSDIWHQEKNGRLKFKPSIHMPRWASRITLEITGVRVERLSDISESDAFAEGAERPVLSPTELHGMKIHPLTGSYENGFRSLWESINGKGSWELNPWVWVVSFNRKEPAQ